jgi:hypothetical protein
MSLPLTLCIALPQAVGDYQADRGAHDLCTGRCRGLACAGAVLILLLLAAILAWQEVLQCAVAAQCIRRSVCAAIA